MSDPRRTTCTECQGKRVVMATATEKEQREVGVPARWPVRCRSCDGTGIDRALSSLAEQMAEFHRKGGFTVEEAAGALSGHSDSTREQPSGGSDE